jgi:hypothetical protein
MKCFTEPSRLDYGADIIGNRCRAGGWRPEGVPLSMSEADDVEIIPSFWEPMVWAFILMPSFCLTIYILVAHPEANGAILIFSALFCLCGLVLSGLSIYDALHHNWKLKITRKGIFIRGSSWREPMLIRWEDIEYICVEPNGDVSAVCIYRFGKRRPFPLNRGQLDRSLLKMAELLEERRGAATAARIWSPSA